MKTDALQFFAGGNEMQPRRMDCMGSRENNGDDAGFAMGESCRNAKKPFKNVLADVAAGNVAAQRITKATMEKKAAAEMPSDGHNSGTPDVEGRSLPGDAAGLIESLTNDSIGIEAPPADEVLSVDEETAARAQQIVGEALAEISEVLGLSIFPGLENLSFTEISKDTRAQFTEIVFILKKMVQGFELGRANGMAIETPKTLVDGTTIDAVTDVLRTSTFKIEMACNVLGIADSVQKQVAIKLELYGSSGILQATDPSTLTMASQHTERLFGGLFTDMPQSAELASLMEKVRKLLADNGGTGKSVTVTTDSASTKPDSGQMDAQVYRALLKIDKMAQVGQQNGEASLGEEKADQLKTASAAVQLAKNLSAEAVVDGQENKMLPDFKAGLQQQNIVGAEARISSTLLKMADETIMEQITARLQTVIRSGLSEVRIHLRPESLGEMTMRIRMEGDVVLAKIEVQNQQVKEIMERNLPALRDALAQQNLTTGSFDIQINNGLGRHSNTASQSQWDEQNTAQGNMSQKEKEDDQASSEQQRQPGSETGRRFGSNSVEYFA